MSPVDPLMRYGGASRGAHRTACGRADESGRALLDVLLATDKLHNPREKRFWEAPRAKAAGVGIQGCEDFFAFGRPKGSGAQRSGELCFVELVIATHQNEHRIAGDNVDKSLDLPIGGHVKGRFRQRFDRGAGRATPRR